MGKIIYIDDHRPGVHCYTPEIGQRKPSCPLRLSVGHYGGHYVDSPFELKGRGISFLRTKSDGSYCYRVTARALAKLEEQYPISYEMLLD